LERVSRLVRIKFKKKIFSPETLTRKTPIRAIEESPEGITIDFDGTPSANELKEIKEYIMRVKGYVEDGIVIKTEEKDLSVLHPYSDINESEDKKQ